VGGSSELSKTPCYLGEVAAVEALQTMLDAAGRKYARLHVSAAFHSGLITEASDTLKGVGTAAAVASTTVPVASNYTGGWLNAMQLAEGNYWSNHMRSTVRWQKKCGNNHDTMETNSHA